MRKKSYIIRLATALVLCAAMALGLAGCGAQKQGASALDPKTPVTVSIWNYYNGDQLAAFNQLVDEFNKTVGMEKGIVAVCVSQGDIATLADSLLASVNGEAGAQETPVLAALYAETAYILDNAGALAPMDSYFTEEELAAYVPGFLEEGRFNAKNELLLFPILKSTELFTANKTDWEPFAAATGITLDSISTKEDLTAAAKAYYEWTDSLTPDILEDGKALYGRDSLANYIYIGAYQLGHELFHVEDGKLTVDMDRDTFKTLWDNYYVPFINGYFGAYAKFRSEDCKTGRILALTSSSSSVSYLPTAVTSENDDTHDITTYEHAALPFRDAVNGAVVQQGASYCLLKSTPAQQEGAMEFLKWFTDSERNMLFATMSGYSPVTLEANSRDAISEKYAGDTSTPKGTNILNSLLLCADTFATDETYAVKPFQGSKEVRSIIDSSMADLAEADRAAVVAAITAGASREEAVAKYLTDDYFNAWFDELCSQVEDAIS